MSLTACPRCPRHPRRVGRKEATGRPGRAGGGNLCRWGPDCPPTSTKNKALWDPPAPLKKLGLRASSGAFKVDPYPHPGRAWISGLRTEKAGGGSRQSPLAPRQVSWVRAGEGRATSALSPLGRCGSWSLRALIGQHAGPSSGEDRRFLQLSASAEGTGGDLPAPFKLRSLPDCRRSGPHRSWWARSDGPRGSRAQGQGIGGR